MFWALLLHEFLGNPREFFCRCVQHKTCAKFTHQASVKKKFGNFRLSSLSSALILLALWSLKILGRQQRKNSKDKTFLGSDLAQGLTSNVVHNYLRHVRVKFENFWRSTPWVMATLVHYLESVLSSWFTSFSHITHQIISLEGQPCLGENVSPTSCMILSIYRFLHFELWSAWCHSFSEFLERAPSSPHTLA